VVMLESYQSANGTGLTAVKQSLIPGPSI